MGVVLLSVCSKLTLVLGIRIIGEDKTLSIKVGADAGDLSGEDVILVRGVSADVDRAVKEILKIVDDAKNDEIISSFVRDINSIATDINA